MVSRKKLQPASRYKKRLEGGGGAGFGRVYLARSDTWSLVWYVFTEPIYWNSQQVQKRLAATLRGGFTPACINDTEIPPLYVFTPCVQVLFFWCSWFLVNFFFGASKLDWWVLLPTSPTTGFTNVILERNK